MMDRNRHCRNRTRIECGEVVQEGLFLAAANVWRRAIVGSRRGTIGAVETRPPVLGRASRDVAVRPNNKRGADAVMLSDIGSTVARIQRPGLGLLFRHVRPLGIAPQHELRLNIPTFGQSLLRRRPGGTMDRVLNLEERAVFRRDNRGHLEEHLVVGQRRVNRNAHDLWRREGGWERRR